MSSFRTNIKLTARYRCHYMTNGRRQKTKFKLNWINTVFVLGTGRYLQPLLFCESNFFDFGIDLITIGKLFEF